VLAAAFLSSLLFSSLSLSLTRITLSILSLSCPLPPPPSLNQHTYSRSCTENTTGTAWGNTKSSPPSSGSNDLEEETDKGGSTVPVADAPMGLTLDLPGADADADADALEDSTMAEVPLDPVWVSSLDRRDAMRANRRC
jgi:hypothetical protein